MPNSGVPHLDDQNFQQVAMSQASLIVDFYGEHCGPCKQIAPLIAELSRKSAGKFGVAKVDVAHAPNTVRALGVQSTPTLIIFENGREAARFVGANNILFKLKPLLK
jgi:thioredoxin 1